MAKDANLSVESSRRWVLVVDLDRCTGCQACVVACHAENNVPVAGEKQAAYGRWMHWIIIQRYWEGEYPNVKARFMPVMCQQCTEAPCEPVCPVFATYHNEEGLNAQIYNRCIGTRFCGSACPYKVRTYNWFRPEFPEPLTEQLNPDVTVRTRGIMEKCTFCIQRIRRTEIDAQAEDACLPMVRFSLPAYKPAPRVRWSLAIWTIRIVWQPTGAQPPFLPPLARIGHRSGSHLSQRRRDECLSLIALNTKRRNHDLRRAFATGPTHRLGDQPGRAPADDADRKRLLGAGDHPEPDCGLGVYAWGYLVYWGIGVTGKNRPVYWTLFITTFVFWVGISHAGTMISAVLRLLKGRLAASDHTRRGSHDCFRADDGRLYPLIHLGRVWKFYWMIPTLITASCGQTSNRH